MIIVDFFRSRNLIVVSIQLVSHVHQMVAKVHASVVQRAQHGVRLLSHPDLRQLASESLEQSGRSVELSLGFNAWFNLCDVHCYYNKVFFLNAQLFCRCGQ